MPRLSTDAVFLCGVFLVIFCVCPGLDFRSKDIHSLGEMACKDKTGPKVERVWGTGQNMKTGTQVEGDMEELQLSESGHQETH